MTSSESQNTEDRQPKWCERCQCFHRWTPPWEVTEAALIAEMSQAIADEIDNEILQELMGMADERRSL